jgi:hypothetical protein
MKSEESHSNPPKANQPTPPQDDPPSTVYASYVSHDIKYNGAFEDSMMAVVLDVSSSTPKRKGISPESTSPESLPVVNEEDLPLPLSDPRRKFTSPIPGVLLTHPGGYFEGGPGLDPEIDTFVEDFVERNAGISPTSSAAVLRSAVQQEVDQNMEMLKERMEARRKAHERNEQIDKELKIMTDQHAMEMKINRKLAEERRAKKEAKERRRKGER